MTGGAALRRRNLAVWLDTENLSVLVDSDRWLAHAIIVDTLWLVFNATHLGDSGRGFAFLGARNTLERAKELADRSILGERVPIIIDGWTPPSRETDSDPGLPASGHLEWLLWHGDLPNALERAAHAVESAAFTDGESWRSAKYLAATLVRTVERIGLLCFPQPAEWLPLADASREIRRGVMRKNADDLRNAMTNFRRQLFLIKPTDNTAPS